PLDVREPGCLPVELLFRGFARILGVASRVEREPYTAQPASGRGMVVEPDHPEPAALEHVVDRTLVPGYLRLVRRGVVEQVVGAGDIDHVVPHRPRVVLESARVLPQG